MTIDLPVIIFGGTGSLGQKLIERFLSTSTRVIVYSRDEAKHWQIRNRFASESAERCLDFIVGDIRDARAVESALRTTRAGHVIIAAALKQVDTCERFPYESLATNIMGVQNVIDAAATAEHVTSVCFVSSDKACSPVNVYGMCKAIAERLTVSKTLVDDKTRYFTVRYGNVLNSRGSIIPLFQQQAQTADAFTITHKGMTRFLMTLDDSVDLIIDALQHAKSSETWIPKLKAMRIIDLAQIFARRYDKSIKVIGIRPGEKLDEALVNDIESLRLSEKKFNVGDVKRNYYILNAPYMGVNSSATFQGWYTSADELMDESALEVYLDAQGLIDV